MDWKLLLLILIGLIAYNIYSGRKNKRDSAEREKQDAAHKKALSDDSETWKKVHEMDKEWREATGQYCWCCHYWDAGKYGRVNIPGESGSQECRRHPPSLDPSGQPVWPETDAYEWCGEFKDFDPSWGDKAWEVKK